MCSYRISLILTQTTPVPLHYQNKKNGDFIIAERLNFFTNLLIINGSLTRN
jgi:hypothetical protein